MAKRANLKIMLYANGIGPVSGESDRARVARAVKKADCITLREQASFDELVAMGIEKSIMTVSADPALSLNPCSVSRAEYLLSHLGLSGKRLIAVSLRDHSSIEPSAFADNCAKAIDTFCKKHSLTPVFIPMQPTHDKRICNKAAQSCKNSVVLPQLEAEELIALLGRCEMVLGMRLHLLIYSLCAGKAPLGISYDPKIDAFLSYAELPAPLASSELSADALLQYLESGFSDIEKLNSAAEETAKSLRAIVEQDAEKAIALTNK